MSEQDFSPLSLNGQPTKVGQFNAAFVSNESNHNRIDLPTFLVKRIVTFGRLSMGACPAHRLFWQNQITAYHRALKAAMVNPILRSGGDR